MSAAVPGNFAKQQLEQGDGMFREADRLMAEAIQIVAGLRHDGRLPAPQRDLAEIKPLAAELREKPKQAQK